MKPQYLAAHCSSNGGSATFESQDACAQPKQYLFSASSHSFGLGYTQVTSLKSWGQAGRSRLVFNEDLNRRNRCQRASKQYWHSALWLSWRPVIGNSQSKSSWLLNPCQFRLSRSIPANTNNSGSRQAFRSASLIPTAMASRIGGAT